MVRGILPHLKPAPFKYPDSGYGFIRFGESVALASPEPYSEVVALWHRGLNAWIELTEEQAAIICRLFFYNPLYEPARIVRTLNGE